VNKQLSILEYSKREFPIFWGIEAPVTYVSIYFFINAYASYMRQFALNIICVDFIFFDTYVSLVYATRQF
ncbi:MAG TPA: hypothetical protein P5322_13260, partial [Spirochaetota bacterium]|nr:hypothetical protein [Spirochaetota bacterium]